MKKQLGRSKISVGLFVTCLVDIFSPTVGFAAVKLLKDAGCEVTVPTSQTCCGQPTYNSGDLKSSKAIAKQVINTFENFDAVVAPSGSCGGMIKRHYPELFADEKEWKKRSEALSEKTYELVSFLTDELNVASVKAKFKGSVTYHDSCSGLRELGVMEQPRNLLRTVEGLNFKELTNADVCCGFGGVFCIKYSDISTRMVQDKIVAVADTGAKTLLAGDMGCLLNIAGRLTREGYNIKARHVAEILSGMADRPAIGHSKTNTKS